MNVVCLGSPYAEGIVLFNGTNTDDSSKAIYARWVEKHKDTDKISGSRTADMRSALVDYFREEGRIMIATEAGAEGINLQFCALVVNYDLPWNPQRIEQRIGRCHRYGQKHDVVVVNFLNRKNEADLRVFRIRCPCPRCNRLDFVGPTTSAGRLTGPVPCAVLPALRPMLWA